MSVLYIYHLKQNICFISGFCWREHIGWQNTLPSIIQQKYTIKSSLKATPAATARELTWQLQYTDLVEQTILNKIVQFSCINPVIIQSPKG